MRNNLSFGMIIGGLSLSIALLNVESPKATEYSGNYAPPARTKTQWAKEVKDSLSSYPLPFEYKQSETALPDNTSSDPSHGRIAAPFAYTFDEAQIVGEAGALGQDMSLSISGLETPELPPLEQGMVNVTGTHAAYRMLPHGTKFNKDIAVVLPYDSTLLPIGYTPNDIMTYYYDELRRQWVVIPRDTVDESNKLVYSRVNHFTDFINAIIKTPEMPETQAYTPTSIKDLKAANPMEGINLIQPPTANNNGTANLSYPIDIPAGRQGMQPNLALTYSSGGGNGWLGVGWDISIPAITVETRWGVPRYDAAQESEVYLYQGEQLVNRDAGGHYKPLRHRTNANLPRLSGNVRFYPRVEEAFDSIVRHGNSPANYWWEVTDRNGITSYYGKSHSSNSLDPNSVLKNDITGNIAHWALTETRAPYGNRVLYFYTIVSDYNNSSNTGNQGKQIYLSRINYTADNSGEGKYNIYFNLRGTPRKDINVSGKYGFKEVSARLLCNININYESEYLYVYQFITETKQPCIENTWV